MASDGISVIIPAYNVDGFIAEAFASVAAQTKSVHEILVIDDGSTDKTAAWLREMARQDARLRVLTSARLGPGGARNVGLNSATQSIIAFLDADDAWPRDKIERQMDRLSAADRPDVVSGLIQTLPQTRAWHPDARWRAWRNDGSRQSRRLLCFAGGFSMSSGPLTSAFSTARIVDLMFRVREAGLKLTIMREVTLYYRIRPGSLTQTKTSEDQKKRDALKALRLSIGRRRSAGGA